MESDDVPELNRRRTLLGLAAVGGVLAVGAGGLAEAAGWLRPDALTPADFADRFEQVSGRHEGFRRNHAKGLAATGTFTSTGAGAQVSKAQVFKPGTVPVVGRFSLSGGLPDQPDKPDTVRGLGLMFRLPDGEQWRVAMVNWLGGLGIAFVVMIFLPVMRVGGMQFFRTEGFDTFGKVLPRATDIARQLLYAYGLLTLACILTYAGLGLSALDAVVNGMATIATGGFSPADASFTKYQGLPEYAGAFFMLAGSLPYIRYVQLMNGSATPLWRDLQTRAYLRWYGSAVLVVATWRATTSDMGLEPTFRETAFNLASIMSGTGFFSGSFGAWGGLSMVVAFVLGVIGGCSGSSSGALSVFRVQVLASALASQVSRIASPSVVAQVRYGGRAVEEDVMTGLMTCAPAYILTIGLMSALMTLAGVDLVSSIFGIWTSIGNIGYGYGPMLAPTGTFVAFPDPAKWIMILTMLMGRLSLLAFFVLALPRFWRR